MDDADQARAYSEADFSESHQRFVDLFVKRFPAWRQAAFRVVDLGCGPADVTVRFALAHPRAEVVGVDAAQTMLELGRARVRVAGLDERVRLERRRLPDETLDGAGYDAGISNSLLHHLPDPDVLWRTVARSLVPGAPILVMDLCRPADDEAVAMLVGRYMADAPAVLARDFRASLRAAYRPDEVRVQIRQAPLDLEVEQVTDRHLVVWGNR
jgi:SAM-dependent methyltransferase